MIAIVLMMLAIFVDGAGRYVFNHPVIGTREVVTQYLMIATVWLAFSKTQRLGGHVSIDLVMRKTSARVQTYVHAFTSVLGAAVVVLLCAGAMRPLITKFDVWTMGSVDFPIAPAWAAIVIGSAVLTLRLLLEAATTLLNGSTSSDEAAEMSAERGVV